MTPVSLHTQDDAGRAERLAVIAVRTIPSQARPFTITAVRPLPVIAAEALQEADALLAHSGARLAVQPADGVLAHSVLQK